MRPIAVFYHCLFFLDDRLLPRALEIVERQMGLLKSSGLENAASFILCGINGGEESKPFSELLLPSKSKKVFHGLKSKAENLTIIELEKWLPDHPGWDVLYFHSKGCTHEAGPRANLSHFWSECMMRNLVLQWSRCRLDLMKAESVGCHWMTGLVDGTQNIWAGNYWWARSDFLQTLPSMWKRDRITLSGIAAAESRYESEVWIGFGPRLPTVIDYHPDNPTQVHGSA